MTDAKIFVDTREKNTEVYQLLKSWTDDVVLKRLDVCDAIIVGIEVMAIERKTDEDYVDSLFEGRLNNQLYKMSTNFPYSMLLVEGSFGELLIDDPSKRPVVYASLAGGMLRRSPDGEQGSISIINVSDPEDTALMIYYLYKKLQGDNLVRLPHFPKLEFSDNERAMAVLSTFEDIAETRATNLLNEMKTLRNVFIATTEELIAVKMIGKKTAEKLNRVLDHEYKGKRKVEKKIINLDNAFVEEDTTNIQKESKESQNDYS